MGGYLKALQNAVFRLMIPSIVFSAVMFLPKMLFHSTEISVHSFMVNVLGGVSYWFTSALFVAQVALLTLIALLRRKDIWDLFVMQCVAVYSGMVSKLRSYRYESRGILPMVLEDWN